MTASSFDSTTSSASLKTSKGRILLALALGLLCLSVAVWGQGFGEPDHAFGSSSSERVFESQPQQSGSSEGGGYFIHDQLAKFLAVFGFTLAALVIILLRRFALRRWLLLASVIVLGFLLGGMLCPISAVQNVILKASTGYLLLFLVPTIAALFAGRLFCGYICPFGALQELLHVQKLRVRIPDRWMKILRWIPYAILVYLVVRVFATGILSWSGTTPFKAFFTFGGTAVTWAISATFAVLSIVVFRPFCRLSCPLGSWLSLVSRISPFRVRVGSTCVSCGKCDDACSFCAIEGGHADASTCLLCGECIRECPVGALRIAGRSNGA